MNDILEPVNAIRRDMRGTICGSGVNSGIDHVVEKRRRGTGNARSQGLIPFYVVDIGQCRSLLVDAG